jgi:hypothetical protein
MKHCYKQQPGWGESYSHAPTSTLHILLMGALRIQYLYAGLDVEEEGI